MRLSIARIAAPLVLALLLIAPVQAQSPDAESEAAAKELVSIIKVGDQFKALLPLILQQLKPAIVQNRADVERDYDALVPIIQDKMMARITDLEGSIVAVYAGNFSAAELHDLIAFYKTPTGQKLLEKTPLIAQQTMAAGRKFGEVAGREAHQEMVDELRKKGHSI
ncbi:MAG TPA: DUF2059 domain-containing protein [Bradyrhizobium sp.]|nr:DUF2059 domain-containing protein [Bradyrhizobium sp.]